MKFFRSFLAFCVHLFAANCTPSLDIGLTPGYDSSGTAIYLDVSIFIGNVSYSGSSAFLRQISRQDSESEIELEEIRQVSCSGGPPLRTQSIPSAYSFGRWKTSEVNEDTCGFVRYRAWPHSKNYSSCRGSNDLKSEGQGLSGSGMGFLKFPKSSARYSTNISWDLSKAPPDTKYVTSLSAEDLETPISLQTLLETYFLIGNVHSYNKGDFGLYWIDEPPFSTSSLGASIHSLYAQMSRFFHDPVQQYRVFVRHNEHFCESGTGGYRSFTFGWSDLSLERRSENEVLWFIAHEMVHNWIRLESADENFWNLWYLEGSAEYYSLILLHRFELFNDVEYLTAMNARLSGYFTSPALNCTNAEIAKIAWSDGHTHLMGYQRGFAYFVKLATQITRHSNGRHSLDDLILDMVQRRLKGEAYDLLVWLSLLVRELGFSAIEEYDSMADAELVVPQRDSLRPGFILQETTDEKFELGFSEDSLGPGNGLVKNLKPGSRAAQAGVREGDKISPKRVGMWNTIVWNRNYTMIVVRDGEEVEMSWWPRSFEPVVSYQWSRYDNEHGKPGQLLLDEGMTLT
ncbi:MAG: hypothetical protein Q9227_001310 [Pyrenula ochraceoflavens]